MAHKILLVDDDRINTALVKFSLAEQRYDVCAAEDGDIGLQKIKEFNPDLVILDVQMPNMNGYEFINALKSRLEALPPILMLTANETMEDIFKLEGVKGYFVKPVDIKQLLNKIRAILGPNE